MLLYYLFWMFMGYTIHFYIIFGTNLLTGGPAQIVVFLPISVFRRKGISNRVQAEWNLWESYFWNKRNPGDLDWTSRSKRGGHKGPGRALGGWTRPHPHGTLVAPLTDFLRLYISTYPENIQEHHETLFPPPQPFVPVRSHLGAFSGALPEGESITESFYINAKASSMSCE